MKKKKTAVCLWGRLREKLEQLVAPCLLRRAQKKKEEPSTDSSGGVGLQESNNKPTITACLCDQG